MTWLVVGLGNPEPKYAKNRHNVGFMVASELARRMGEGFTSKFKGELARGRLGPQDLLVLKPMTYMNLSGVSVASAATFYKVPLEQIVVIHDELDLPFPDVKVKVGGGHAGHNGLRSIFEHVGRDFVRVRCGIGRPPHGDVAGFVLSDYSKDEAAGLPDVIDTAARAVELIVDRGPLAAMNEIHTKARA
ncbi:MAG: aminoacyl-tRNA hydrolase [Myxococcales bacterium]|nr:aminoacyl-tRNA hydrolase [Myxococcales bacterium]MCB9731529.1 aminoacyl-tRNA hydrolase [Deltaproteobacteria bacterium]